MDTLRYVLAWFLVVLMPPAILYWFAVHPFAAFWRRVGRWAGFTAAFATLIASAVVLGYYAPRWLAADYGLSWPLVGLGVALIVAAAVVQRLRRRHLTARILMGAPELAKDPGQGKLLTEGIYSRVRHPRYVEFFLAAGGYGCIANRPAGYLALVASLLLMFPLIALEERELHERFGKAWEEYAARTPRFFPRLGG